VAGLRVLPPHRRRALPQPSGPQHRVQARSGALCGPHDGRLLLAIGAGNLLAGFAGSVSEKLAPATLFGGLFVITTIMALVLVALTPRIKRMMGDTH